MSGPILGDLSNNTWSVGTIFVNGFVHKNIDKMRREISNILTKQKPKRIKEISKERARIYPLTTKL
jgi:hypothetical protein